MQAVEAEGFFGISSSPETAHPLSLRDIPLTGEPQNDRFTIFFCSTAPQNDRFTIAKAL